MMVRHMCYLLVLCVTVVLPCLATAASPSLVTFQIEVPNGTTQHGNSRMLCPPTTWRSLITFFIGNFVAHIVTVKSVPGEKLAVTVCNMVLALLFPTSGLMRGLNAIARRVSFGTSELDKACRAGALCVVVRNSAWRPTTNGALNVVLVTSTLEPGGVSSRTDLAGQVVLPNSNAEGEHTRTPKRAALEVYHPTWLKEDQRWWVYFDTIWGRVTVNIQLFGIHGTYRLPQGYSFAILPRNAVVLPRIPHKSSEVQPITATTSSDTTSLSSMSQDSGIASSGSVLKIFASILQLLFSYYTVYHHQGDQVQRWGYVSFFLTPLPYAVMSFCNGVSNLLTPDYPKLYMVDSEVMDEARKAGGVFDGVVACTIPLTGPTDDNGYRQGFASTWKGISPTSLKRVLFSALSQLLDRRDSPRCTLSATCVVGKADNTSLELQFEAGEVYHAYEVPSASANPDRSLDELSGHFHEMLRYSPVFWMASFVWCCLRHPQRSMRGIMKWARSTSLPVTADQDTNLIPHRIGFIIWSVCHPRHATRFVYDWLCGLVSLLKLISKESPDFMSLLRGLKRPVTFAQPAQATIYYQSCPRFLRYDDDLLQNSIADAITNSSQVTSACAPLSTPYLKTSFSRFNTDITWRSTVLPVLLGVVLSGIPMIIIGILSHFHPGSSSLNQRVIILLWWTSGSLFGLLMPLLDVTEILVCIVWLPLFLAKSAQDGSLGLMSMSIFPILPMGSQAQSLLLLACVPWSIFVAPIWGFVMVGQMLSEWGSCISLY